VASKRSLLKFDLTFDFFYVIIKMRNWRKRYDGGKKSRIARFKK